MTRKEHWIVEMVIGCDVMAKKFMEEHFARDCFQRLQSKPYELRLWHNREDGVNCRLDVRPVTLRRCPACGGDR